ncbi:MAG: prepilin-type N-terminal cleavage/methylation domain-containing protein [Candidatus Omnitrophica bacterium]|nr:prepilin-type N-terminal cleavage/methylation domain-containing protein [Candidatus Omnitrophota bacterium]
MKGFTLLEVLVAITVFLVIALALGYAVVAGKSALLASDIPTQLRQDLIFSVGAMTHDLRQTAPSKTSIGAGTSASTITFRIPEDTDSDGDVVDAAGNIEWGDEITYAVDGQGRLIRSEGVSSAVVAPDISLLQFSRPAAEDAILQIDIAASKIDGQGKSYQDSEQAVVKMRN